MIRKWLPQRKRKDSLYLRIKARAQGKLWSFFSFFSSVLPIELPLCQLCLWIYQDEGKNKKGRPEGQPLLIIHCTALFNVAEIFHKLHAFVSIGIFGSFLTEFATNLIEVVKSFVFHPVVHKFQDIENISGTVFVNS